MRVTYELVRIIPRSLSEQWSEATQQEKHLTPETPESLQKNVMVSAVAYDAKQPIGFAGLIAARTRQGHGLWWENRQVIELGGAYIEPAYRASGIWRRLVELRLDYARQQDWLVVCITGNPTVQFGLRKLGAAPIAEPEEQKLRDQLCLGCDMSSSCSFCPLAEETSWRLT